MWEKYGRAGQATDENMTRRMRFSCLVTNATNTHTEYLTPIGFLRQKLSSERDSILRLQLHCLSWLQIMLSPWFESPRKNTHASPLLHSIVNTNTCTTSTSQVTIY